jgi:hypothetical protein
MKFELCNDVALTRDLPEERLKRGDTCLCVIDIIA